MQLRPGTVDDIPEIVRLKAQLMTTSYPFPVDLAAHPDWPDRAAAAIADMMGRDAHAFFVIDAPGGSGLARAEAPGGALAGCISAAILRYVPGPDWGAIQAYVADMCTDSAHRGQGYGKALLSGALDWVRAQGAQTVRLDSSPSAVPFYERFGFVRREGDDLFPTMQRAL